MKTRKKQQYIFFFIVVLVILVMIAEGLRYKNSKTPEQSVSNQTETENEYVHDKQNEEMESQPDIEKLENNYKDNQNYKKEEAQEIKFINVQENRNKLSFLSDDELDYMMEQFCKYIAYKKLTEVTEATFHPDSVQKVNDYLYYIYFDIDYKVDDNQYPNIRVTCDQYDDRGCRFAFTIQYGD